MNDTFGNTISFSLLTKEYHVEGSSGSRYSPFTNFSKISLSLFPCLFSFPTKIEQINKQWWWLSKHIRFGITFMEFCTTLSQLRSFLLRTMTGSIGYWCRLSESYSIVTMSPLWTRNGLWDLEIWKTYPCGLREYILSLSSTQYCYLTYNFKEIKPPSTLTASTSVSYCLVWNNPY